MTTPEPPAAQHIADPLRIAVLGAAGRMGSRVCAAVDAADGMTVVARIGSTDRPADVVAAGAEVVVDFTRPDVVLDNLRFCVEHGLHTVVGTSGFDERRLATVADWLAAKPTLGMIVAPNFAIGGVLSMRFAALAARFYPSVEIVEAHHPRKVDAPSGSALRTAETIAAVRQAAGMPPVPDATEQEAPGARGTDVAGLRVHAVRLAGLVAYQDILFGGDGETLSIRHDTLDRGSFMPGVLLAVRSVVDSPGLTVGLEALLGL